MTSEKATLIAMITITQAALDAGVSPDQARYWCQLLGLTTHKVGRNRCLDAHGAAQIREMGRLQANGKTPQEAAALLNAASVVIPTELSPPAKQEDNLVISRLGDVERALFAVVEELKASRQESAAIRAEVMALRQDNQTLRQDNQVIRQLLLPPAELPAIVQPWSPPPMVDPRSTAPWYQVLWWTLFDPIQLRRCNSC